LVRHIKSDAEANEQLVLPGDCQSNCWSSSWRWQRDAGGGSTTIHHQGTLTLAFNTWADLGASPSDRQWGQPSANPDAGGADLSAQSPGFVGVNSATIVTVNSGTDTTCQNATGWLAPNSYQDLHLSVGGFVWVHTSQGRYSLLRVEAINSTTNAVDFWVKTFKKSGD
jgi:hypothetical protein